MTVYSGLIERMFTQNRRANIERIPNNQNLSILYFKMIDDKYTWKKEKKGLEKKHASAFQRHNDDRVQATIIPPAALSFSIKLFPFIPSIQ